MEKIEGEDILNAIKKFREMTEYWETHPKEAKKMLYGEKNVKEGK